IFKNTGVFRKRITGTFLYHGGLGAVAHACNPSYLGGRVWRITQGFWARVRYATSGSRRQN
uniref:Uncharacterized protein n=1 Tax=Chrysemys picta bellii TaxID=8478 RepID=A0A8C3IKZ4_CHRPI